MFCPSHLKEYDKKTVYTKCFEFSLNDWILLPCCLNNLKVKEGKISCLTVWHFLNSNRSAAAAGRSCLTQGGFYFERNMCVLLSKVKEMKTV